MAGTSAEENAVRAVMGGDPGEARRILEDFFPSELDQFAAHLDMLKDLTDQVLREKSAR